MRSGINDIAIAILCVWKCQNDLTPSNRANCATPLFLLRLSLQLPVILLEHDEDDTRPGPRVKFPFRPRVIACAQNVIYSSFTLCLDHLTRIFGTHILCHPFPFGGDQAWFMKVIHIEFYEVATKTTTTLRHFGNSTQ